MYPDWYKMSWLEVLYELASEQTEKPFEGERLISASMQSASARFPVDPALRGGRVDNRLCGAAGQRWWDRAQWQVHIWTLTICLENTAPPLGRFPHLWETEEGIPRWEPSWEWFMCCQYFILQPANMFVRVSIYSFIFRLHADVNEQIWD